MSFSFENKLHPCTISELFINHEGDVYPCCRKWNSPTMKIGTINDNKIIDKIINYEKNCCCGHYTLRKVMPTDTEFSKINIEFSLDCNGSCAMCCVDAPSWRGKYNLYEKIYNLILTLKPKKITVQGGEVLSQRQTLDLLSSIKSLHPLMKFHIITNGCFSSNLLPLFNILFETATCSIVGFSEMTYKTIMGLNLEKTKKFVEGVLDAGKCDISPKYLMTPLNIHEVGLFIDWAARINPSSIQIVDANIEEYVVRNTKIPYWNRIYNRCGKYIVDGLSKNETLLSNNKTTVFISPAILKNFNVDLSILNNKISIKPYG
jgi:uncharacterized radical SAM superfamily Fe-S cluster-containing enzyme